eukprot:Lankesteria_metandrocarpae@DN3441_c1_g1_i1.p1
MAAAASPATNVVVFVIVGKGDTPLYEADLSGSGKREDTPHLDQFIIHTALDVVDDAVWQSTAMFLKVADEFNDFQVSAYVTAGHVKFALLHKGRPEEAVRQFFIEVHELFIKTLLNPFYEPNALITSQSFDSRVRAAAKKYIHS